MTRLQRFLISPLLLSCMILVVSPGPSGAMERGQELSMIHNEVPDDPYIASPRSEHGRSPATRFTRDSFFAVQVNIDAFGQNIVGDAANEPSIAVDPTDPERLDRIVIPLIARYPQISSFLVARTDGTECLLLREKEKWLNRLSRPREWGRRVRWLRVTETGKVLKRWTADIDYDARKRPWFLLALKNEGTGEPAWTKPYLFATTREPGITASIVVPPSEAAAGRSVVAFDILLRDGAEFAIEGNPLTVLQADFTGSVTVNNNPYLASEGNLEIGYNLERDATLKLSIFSV